MNLCATQFDATSQTTVIAAGHNEKCQTYDLKLALENQAKEKENEANNNPGIWEGCFY
jgi:hypothetical protein